MVAAIVRPDDLRGLGRVVDVYVDQWLALVSGGLTDEALADAAWQDPAERDRRNRAAMFSPRTNPVWGFLDRIVGAPAAADMQVLLTTQS